VGGASSRCPGRRHGSRRLQPPGLRSDNHRAWLRCSNFDAHRSPFVLPRILVLPPASAGLAEVSLRPHVLSEFNRPSRRSSHASVAQITVSTTRQGETNRYEMATTHGDDGSFQRLARAAVRIGKGHAGERVPRLFKIAAVALVMTLCMAVAPPPNSAADATANLQTQVDAARGGCPPLHADPVLTDVARRANGETQSNIEHTARSLPFEDPMPILHDLGYPARKAKLLAGYGDAQAKAIRGAVLFGWESIPDCSYTRYGVNVLEGSAGNYWLAAIILAGN
jgi:hypothetical protein